MGGAPRRPRLKLESGFSSTADANNHIPAWGYDASGNTQGDGTYTYTWDAESQLKSAGGVNYLYDGDGRRVSKSNGKLYWYDSGSDILAETDACGNTTAEYIFFGGKRIAMIPWSGPSCSPTVAGNPILLRRRPSRHVPRPHHQLWRRLLRRRLLSLRWRALLYQHLPAKL